MGTGRSGRMCLSWEPLLALRGAMSSRGRNGQLGYQLGSVMAAERRVRLAELHAHRFPCSGWTTRARRPRQCARARRPRPARPRGSSRSRAPLPRIDSMFGAWRACRRARQPWRRLRARRGRRRRRARDGVPRARGAALGSGARTHASCSVAPAASMAAGVERAAGRRGRRRREVELARVLGVGEDDPGGAARPEARGPGHTHSASPPGPSRHSRGGRRRPPAAGRSFSSTAAMRCAVLDI